MIKKGIINELIKTQDLISLEKHLIYSYLKNNKLDYTKSILLTEYFQNFESSIQLYLDVSSLNITTIKELENYLEIIIPIDDRKVNGAFFTPDFIVDFIINEIKPAENEINLDPSCGCGAFLVGLVDYYKKKFNISIRKIIKENIYGSDILEYNIHRAKLILTIYALQNNETLLEDDFNLWCQDSLRVFWKTKFDNIVGNPPYVKFQDLSDYNREHLPNHWETIKGGSFNLYFAFFELGYKLLKSNGKLGYITPNNYFTSLSGESLRRYFQSQQCVTKIVDFNHKKVFDVQTYTAITFLNKQKNEMIIFDRIQDDQTPKMFLDNSIGYINYLKNQNIKKWRLLKSDEQENIKIIENVGTPIGNLYEICVGIATLKDEIFFVDASIEKNGCYLKDTQNGRFEIEKGITKPVYKISDFKSQEEADRNKRRIICPYKIKNGNAIPISENEFKKMFPKCYSYLLTEKKQLLERDKGKYIFEPFYVWGRTQGLTKKGKKLLNPTFSQYPRFLLIEEEAYFTNGYGIFFKEQEKEIALFEEVMNPLAKVENMDILQKILNSYVMHYYISKTSVSIEGGYPCYQKNFIENFTIPKFSESELSILRLLDKPQEIDDFLINKYQLKVLEGNLTA
ncbi:MAG: N-6 DNA methylase [Ignavibacteriales bacterium]|nr:N-6 DNA methylase [Ignavibacteriales bacterium]